MTDDFGNVKNMVFVITIFAFIMFIPIFIIAIGRYNTQVSEIENLEKQIKNQQIIIDYLQNGSENK